ncbi:hypothetical protein GCM10009087_04690 [Sphingomonas oligophenolica]|uniref:Rap1a immunity protein domain-containing protein n=1 Tax=Sphingomonas oligophenolica TaxID=301154 RepID=A0ABU9Y5T8_9SPHN
MRGMIKAGALAFLVIPAMAQAMTVDEFLAKAAALQAKGMVAMVSPDLGLVRDEIKTAATAYRADLDGAQAAGRKPRSCPPPKGQAKIDSNTLIASFRTIPAAKRTMSVKAAFYSFMDKRYPCP